MTRFRTKRRRRIALALAPTLTSLAIFGAAPAGAAEADGASFDASKKRVNTGQKVRLNGSFPVAQSGPKGDSEDAAPKRERVTIEFQRAGQKRWKPVKKTEARKNGSYSQRVKVRVTGRYRAVDSAGQTTAAERIRARAKLKVKVRRKDATSGQKVPIKGQVVPRGKARKVTVKVDGERINTRTRRNGTFRVKWRANGTGTHKVRAKAKGDKLASGSRTRTGKVTVYRPAQASWYGPGFYGNRTACGQTLTTGTVGVAHKTMPCGTKLKLRYKGNTVPVRVIDRGPFHGNREFDLTGATKQKLGFGSTGIVYASK